MRSDFDYDQRASIAMPILIFFGTLITAVLLWMILWPAASDMLEIGTSFASTESSATGIGYVDALWSNIHLIVILLSGVTLLVAAYYNAQVGGV